MKKNIPDKATYKRILQHLSDPNDIITEEDILNAKTDLTGNDGTDGGNPGEIQFNTDDTSTSTNA